MLKSGLSTRANRQKWASAGTESHGLLFDPTFAAVIWREGFAGLADKASIFSTDYPNWGNSFECPIPSWWLRGKGGSDHSILAVGTR